MSMLLNKAIMGIFKQFSTYVIRVQYTVIKAIILEGYINGLSKTALKFENNRQRLLR